MGSPQTVREVLLAEGFTAGCPDLIAVESWCQREGLVFDFDLVGLHEVECLRGTNAFPQTVIEKLMKVFKAGELDPDSVSWVPHVPLVSRRLAIDCAAGLAL